MDEKNDTKIGAGHLAAMGRLGLAELRNAFYPDSNVAQRHAEYGIFGSATPQEVMQGKRDELQREEAVDAWLADRLQRSREPEAPQKETPEMEREQ